MDHRGREGRAPGADRLRILLHWDMPTGEGHGSRLRLPGRTSARLLGHGLRPREVRLLPFVRLTGVAVTMRRDNLRSAGLCPEPLNYPAQPGIAVYLGELL